MHNNTTGKINDSALGEPTSTPYPIAYWAIDNYEPKPTENKNCRKFNPLYKGSHYEGRGNNGKSHLKHDPNRFGVITV